VSKKKIDAGEAIAAIILGVLGGILLAAILSSIFSKKYRCPNCNNFVTKGTPCCPACNAALRWD